MNLRSPIILSLIFLLGSFNQKAFCETGNPIENDSLLRAYLLQTRFDLDTNAHAIVLFEKGQSALIDGTLRYQVEKAIKITGVDAISEAGIVNIPKGSYASLTKVKGITYNLENGVIVKQELNHSDILKEKLSDDFSVTKFNFPGVKNGSIIYYTYTLERPGFYSVPEWVFQEKYPKLLSEYSITLPTAITYTPLERVSVLRRAAKASELQHCESCTFISPGNSGLASQTWVRRNIPAFEREPYMSSSENYVERVRIHIVTLYINNKWININKDWKEITKENILDNDHLCGQLKNGNNFLNDKVKMLTQQATSDLEKARILFSYVRNNYTARESGTGEAEVYDIKDIFKTNEGSDAGINLLLTAMLRKANLVSDPVALSTKSKERLNHHFPDPSRINYLITKVTINKKDYFLDASVKELPFGILLPDCYNGYCRVINDIGTATSLEPDSISDKALSIVSITPDDKEKNKLNFTFTKQIGALSGIFFRKKWAKDTAEIRKTILKEISGFTATDVQLKSFSVDNLSDPDKPLKLNYKVTTTLTKEPGTTTIYLDPYFDKFFDANPFTSAKRAFDVEMDYLEDLNYVLNFKLPDGYVLDDYPKSSASQFLDNGQIVFKNAIAYESSNNSLSIKSKFCRKSNKFSAADYSELKAFYGNVVDEMHKKIIIKKQN